MARTEEFQWRAKVTNAFGVVPHWRVVLATMIDFITGIRRDMQQDPLALTHHNLDVEIPTLLDGFLDAYKRAIISLFAYDREERIKFNATFTQVNVVMSGRQYVLIFNTFLIPYGERVLNQLKHFILDIMANALIALHERFEDSVEIRIDDAMKPPYRAEPIDPLHVNDISNAIMKTIIDIRASPEYLAGYAHGLSAEAISRIDYSIPMMSTADVDRLNLSENVLRRMTLKGRIDHVRPTIEKFVLGFGDATIKFIFRASSIQRIGRKIKDGHVSLILFGYAIKPVELIEDPRTSFYFILNDIITALRKELVVILIDRNGDEIHKTLFDLGDEVPPLVRNEVATKLMNMITHIRESDSYKIGHVIVRRDAQTRALAHLARQPQDAAAFASRARFL